MVTTFSTTGGTSPSVLVSGLTDGGSYTYFIRCQDSLGNQNTDDFVISFSVSDVPLIFADFQTGDLAGANMVSHG